MGLEGREGRDESEAAKTGRERRLSEYQDAAVRGPLCTDVSERGTGRGSGVYGPLPHLRLLPGEI
ncbi:hypothetical protein [Diplocloster hominis]|uniref:hypothetical protein n=1 Tax=Diplocloster hominis TaxID=3079010 RepID=UPI0031BAB494